MCSLDRSIVWARISPWSLGIWVSNRWQTERSSAVGLAYFLAAFEAHYVYAHGPVSGSGGLNWVWCLSWLWSRHLSVFLSPLTSKLNSGSSSNCRSSRVIEEVGWLQDAWFVPREWHHKLLPLRLPEMLLHELELLTGTGIRSLYSVPVAWNWGES